MNAIKKTKLSQKDAQSIASKRNLSKCSGRSNKLPKSVQSTIHSRMITSKASIGGKSASKFTIRSNVIKSKVVELQTVRCVGKGTSQFTIRSELPEEGPRPEGDWWEPPNRMTLIRQVYMYLAQLLCLHLFISCLWCYLANFDRWNMLLLVLCVTSLITFSVSLFAYFIKWDLTILFKVWVLIVILVIIILGAIPYMIHESVATRSIFETVICTVDLFFLAMTTQMIFGEQNRANPFPLELTVLHATFALYVEIILLVFFLPYLKFIKN